MPTDSTITPRERAEFLCDTAGSILSIHVRGEIDHHTASSIRQGIDTTLFEKRPTKLILDLSAVSFMDSSGLGLIMGRYSVMKELGGEMTVWNPSPETRAILKLAGMERLVRIEYPAGQEPRESAEAGTAPAPRSHANTPRRTTPQRRKRPAGAGKPPSRKEKNA